MYTYLCNVIKFNTMKTPKMKDTHGRVILIAGLTWVIVYIGCLLIVKEWSTAKAPGIVFSFLPTLAFAWFIYAFSRGIGKMDEVEVRIYLEAGVIAFCLCILLVMTLGLLDLAVQLNKEDWGYRHLVPYFVLFYFIGIFFTRKKYSAHEE